jgi:hypothetical protein
LGVEHERDDAVTIGGIFLRDGEQAPRAGPARVEWCVPRGLETLDRGRREYGIAVRELLTLLPEGLGSLPRNYPLHVIQPAAQAVQVGRRRVAQWFGLRRRFDKWRDGAGAGAQECIDSRFGGSERHARDGLQAVCDAYNYLEDVVRDYPDVQVRIDESKIVDLPKLVEDAHVIVHRCGELVGGMFGCHMEYKDGQWLDKCLVSLLHLRFGQSAGLTVRYVCTIGGGDAGDVCGHKRGVLYPKTAAQTEDGLCTICDAERCSAHEVGVTYEAVADYGMVDIQVQEVSIVPRPRDPLARITERSVRNRELLSKLGEVPKPGELVLCHQCMYPCTGFSYWDEAAGR